jgi:integrase
MTENKFKFTIATLKALKVLDGKVQTFYWDTEVKGLGMKVLASGKKVFIYQNRLLNESIRLTLKLDYNGSLIEEDGKTYSSLEMARKIATKYQVMMAEGIDPRQANEDKQLQRDTRKRLNQEEKLKQSVRVQTAWDEYIKFQQSKMSLEGLKKGEKWGERHYQDHLYATQAGGAPSKIGKKLLKQGVLYPLMQYKLIEITPQIIQAWLIEEQKTRANAVRQAFSKFSVFWNWLKTHETYKSIIDSTVLENQQLKAFLPSKQTSDRILDPVYLADWFKGVTALSNKTISTYLQCLILTGARRNEMAELKWKDIQWKTKTIKLKDKMTDKGRVIPLHPYIEHLFNKLERKNEFVFWGDSESGHLTEPRKAHNQVLEQFDIPHLGIHDLRRTFCTYFSDIHDGAGRRIAGHTDGDVHQKVYIKLTMAKLAQYMNIYVTDLLEQAKIKFEVSEQLVIRLVK